MPAGVQKDTRIERDVMDRPAMPGGHRQCPCSLSSSMTFYARRTAPSRCVKVPLFSSPAKRTDHFQQPSGVSVHPILDPTILHSPNVSFASGRHQHDGPPIVGANMLMIWPLSGRCAGAQELRRRPFPFRMAVMGAAQ